MINSRLRKFIFPLILALLPILLIGIIEIGLRIFDYGPNLDLFEPYPELNGYLIPNPDVALRYFPPPSPTGFPTDDIFLKDKPDNTKRIFVLGGSSTAGFPYFFNGCFSISLEDRLIAAYPDYNFEVINLGMTAVGSYTVREFARTCLDYEPDLLVIYAGHNEFYGVLGSGSTLSGAQANRTLTLALLKLRHLKLYQLIQDGARRIKRSTAANETGTLMARMAGDQAIPIDSEKYTRTAEIFCRNLADIVNRYQKQNVPVVLSTLASNLCDQPPFVSLPEDTTAEGHFNIARLAEHNGQFTRADYHYSRARDLDGLRFRASSDFNKTIKSFGKRSGVYICDVEHWFKSISPNGLTGTNLMLEHLHPNQEGYFQIGKALAGTVIDNRVLGLKARPLPPDEFFYRLSALTELDHTIADYQVQVLLSGWPFQPGKRHLYLSDIEPATTIEALALQTLKKELNFWDAHYQAAEYYIERQDLKSAQQEARALIRAFPYRWQGYLLIGKIKVLGRDYSGALQAFHRVESMVTEPYSQKWIGTILLNNQQPEQAIPYLEKANSMLSNDYQLMYNLSGAYMVSGQLQKAFKLVQQIKTEAPDFPGIDQLYAQLTGLLKK